MSFSLTIPVGTGMCPGLTVVQLCQKGTGSLLTVIQQRHFGQENSCHFMPNT